MNANPGTSKLSNKFRFLGKLNISVDVINRLSVSLNSVIKGNDTSILTPLVKDLDDPTIILKEWDEFFNANKHKLNSTLIELEMSNRDKFGSRSIQKNWLQRIDDVKSYFIRRNCKFVMPKLPERGSLRPISIHKAVSKLKSSTSSGLPFLTKKSKIKQEVLENFYLLLDRNDPCILFTRTQEGNKTRTVWGFPVADTTNELRFYLPLLEYQKQLKWRSALVGPDLVDKYVSELVKASLEEEDVIIISMDFSAYDASISSRLIRAAFAYIKRRFQYDFSMELSYICERIINIGLVTPFGVYYGEHGVPSGSTFTNEVDSIVQYLIALSSGVVDVNKLQIQGDDGLVVIKLKDVPRLELAFKDAGLNFNTSKSYKSKEFCVYLQNLYHKDYADENGFIGGIYPVYRALNRLCFQERWSNFEEYGMNGIDYYSLRSYSILENCKYHPLFEEFVKFIKSKDKYNLSYNPESTNKYVEMLNNGPGTGGVLNHHYGLNLKGIRKFKSYKLSKRIDIENGLV